MQLAGGSGRMATAAMAAIAAVVLHAATLGYIAVKGNRPLRVVAALSLGGHLTMMGMVRAFKYRVAAAARTALKDDE